MFERSGYSHVWVFDWEYRALAGEVPDPVCCAMWDLITGQRVSRWRGDWGQCPADTGSRSLFVCYSGTGDLQCFRQVWGKVPDRLVDLYAEHRMRAFGMRTPPKSSLLAAAAHYSVTAFESAAKDAARDMIIGGTFTEADRDTILAYCHADVTVTAGVFKALFYSMAADMGTWNGALLRGRYTAALAAIHTTAIPLDVPTMHRIETAWGSIKHRLVREVDGDFGVFDGTTFVQAKFEAYLEANAMPWPRLESGTLDLKDATFRKMAEVYPRIRPLRELRAALSGLRLFDFEIGTDGRNRTNLWPYGSKTGRCQPSNTKFVFGSARWARSLIKPGPGRAVFYADWKSQEIAICAAISGDAGMWTDYITGDPYLAYGKRIGMLPEWADKDSHEALRAVCKAIVLGVNYGMSHQAMAVRAKIHEVTAKGLLQGHSEAYRRFWDYVARVQNQGALGIPLTTPFGWSHAITDGEVNPRSLQNFLSQASGAEMMRLASCLLTEAGVDVCCSVHDAFLIECDIDALESTKATVLRIMGDASELVLGGGRRCGVDIEKVVVYPDRYYDKNAGKFFDAVMRHVVAEEAEATSGLSIFAASPGSLC